MSRRPSGLRLPWLLKCLALCGILCGFPWHPHFVQFGQVPASGWPDGSEARSAILHFLSRGPHGTLAIGKAVFGPAATKKNVNPILYSLEKEGLIERDQEQNWRLKQDQQNPALQMESRNMDLRKLQMPKRMVELFVFPARTGKDVAREEGENRIIVEQLKQLDFTSVLQLNDSVLITRDMKQDWMPKQEQTQTIPCQKFATCQSGPTCIPKLSKEKLCDALSDPTALDALADSLTPSYPPHVQKMIDSTLETVCKMACQCLAVSSNECKAEMIGSRAYDVDIIGSDIDYVLDIGAQKFYKKCWEKLAKKLNQTDGLEGLVTTGHHHISIALEEGPILQFVPLHGDFEYDKVPYSNLLSHTKDGWNRHEVNAKLKDFFDGYPGARNVARVLKAWLIPKVKDLRKQPWSFMLTLIIFREAHFHCDIVRDKVGVDLLRQVVKEFSAYPAPTQKSSVAMAAMWAKNDEPKVSHFVGEAFQRWSESCREVFKLCNAAEKNAGLWC